jgi:hypothetical protein
LAGRVSGKKTRGDSPGFGVVTPLSKDGRKPILLKYEVRNQRSEVIIAILTTVTGFFGIDQ